MILDKLLQLSAEQALTATAASTSYIDTVTAGQAVADSLSAVVTVNTTLASSGNAATLDIVIQTDDNSSFNSATTIATIPQKAEAVCLAGAKWQVALPKTGIERYIRAYYTVGTENFTSGAISCDIAKETDIETIS